MIQQDKEALTSVETVKLPVPWQLWVVGAALVGFFAFCAMMMLPLLGSTIATIAEVFLSQEAAKVKLQAGLVLLGCLVLAGLVTICMLSIPALYRGRPWGLYIAFGTVIVNVATALLGVARLLLTDAPLSYVGVAVTVAVLGSFAGMLLAPSVLHHFSLQRLGRARVALSGTLCGVAAAGLFVAVNYGIAQVGAWMQQDQSAGSPAAAASRP
ncbi:MAG: hypothetical protein ACM3ZT_11095 [Bacillota bacterium]